jgi:cyanophycin synthetase
MRACPMADARGAVAAQAKREFEGSPTQLGVRGQVLRGHAHGLRGPVLQAWVRWPADLRRNTEALAAILGEVGGLEPAEVQRCLANGLDIDALLALVLALETAARSPVTQLGVPVSRAAVREGLTEHALAFASFRPRFTQALLQWLLSSINLCQSNLAAHQRGAMAKTIDAKFEMARAALHAQLKTLPVNTVRIARACGEMDLPLQWLPRGILHVGSGRHARVFKSTMTETTSALAAALARSKSLTASVLALRGFPVPRHKPVASEQEAVQAANALGYPVVVKPDDSDGGLGVSAGLLTDDQVRQCYGQAAAVSPNVLVEKHVEGQDYRITVDNGKVVKAIGRQPGGVLGDGRGTVEELVRAAAATPEGRRRGDSNVSLDGEALELLAERGMSARSVPPSGDFIALRRRANMSTGGTSRDALGDLHPDNARLAIRATQALRLDIAGIDLIIPDVSVSWMDCKAAICEVNAQPQISTEFAPHVYRDLLARMVPAPCRMRAVLLLDVSGKPDSNADVAMASEQLIQQGERVLSVRTDGAWLDEERVAPAGREPFAAAMAAELEFEATAVVAALTPAQVLLNGLPWLHLDQVRVLRAPGAQDAPDAREAIALLKPHLVGELLEDIAP